MAYEIHRFQVGRVGRAICVGANGRNEQTAKISVPSGFFLFVRVAGTCGQGFVLRGSLTTERVGWRLLETGKERSADPARGCKCRRDWTGLERRCPCCLCQMRVK